MSPPTPPEWAMEQARALLDGPPFDVPIEVRIARALVAERARADAADRAKAEASDRLSVAYETERQLRETIGLLGGEVAKAEERAAIHDAYQAGWGARERKDFRNPHPSGTGLHTAWSDGSRHCDAVERVDEAEGRAGTALRALDRARAALTDERESVACCKAVARATEERLCGALGIDPDGEEADALTVQEMAARVGERLTEERRKGEEAEAGRLALSLAVGQALVAATLAPGERLAEPLPHAIVSAVARLREQAHEAEARAVVAEAHSTRCRNVPGSSSRLAAVLVDRLRGGESAAEAAADYTVEGDPLTEADLADLAALAGAERSLNEARAALTEAQRKGEEGVAAILTDLRDRLAAERADYDCDPVADGAIGTLESLISAYEGGTPGAALAAVVGRVREEGRREGMERAAEIVSALPDYRDRSDTKADDVYDAALDLAEAAIRAAAKGPAAEGAHVAPGTGVGRG